MRILVTGGEGFIGSHIVDKLVELKHHVCIVDNLFAGKEENINKEAIFYKCNITDIYKLKLVFEVEQPEVVSNPEFLAQGTAVHDTLHTARIINARNLYNIEEMHVAEVEHYSIGKPCIRTIEAISEADATEEV